MSTPIQRPGSRPPASGTAPAGEARPAETPQAAPAASAPSAKTPAASAGSAAAPTTYSQAKLEPEAQQAAREAQSRRQTDRSRMTLGRAPVQRSEVASVDKADDPKAASPTSNLSPTELQAARDRFGSERTYKIVDDLFYDRHPEMRGKPIQPHQKELAKEWLAMRAGVEEAGIQKAVAGGKTDPKEIARDVFDARHPDLKGKKLGASHLKELGQIEKQANTSLEPLKNLQESASFKALDAKGQEQALALMRANFADPEARGRVQQAVDSMGSVKSAEGKAQVLEGLVQGSPLTAEKLGKTQSLLGSAKFGALSEADQKLVTGAIQGGKADPKLAENIQKLVEDAKFQGLGASEKTAVLSQVNNYPDARSAHNLQRLIQKDWFGSFDLGDKQRALKTVAFLSQHNGDRTVIDNTLDKFLAPDAPYKFDFSKTGTGYGSAGTDNTFNFNQTYLLAGNGKVDTTDHDTMHMVTHTVAHEVNHLVNNFPPTVEKSYSYFMDEYRAFYMGFKAQNGREPTRQEVLERVQYLLTATAAESKAYNNIRQALADPVEGPKIVAFMKKVLGRDDVTQANAGSLAPKNASDSAPTPEKSAPGDPNNLTNS